MSSPQRFCPTCERTHHAEVCPRCDQVTGIDPMFDWTELVPGMDVTDHPFHVRTVHNMALDLQCTEPRYWWWPYVDRNYIHVEEWEGRRAVRRYTRAELEAGRLEADLSHEEGDLNPQVTGLPAWAEWFRDLKNRAWAVPKLEAKRNPSWALPGT